MMLTSCDYQKTLCKQRGSFLEKQYCSKCKIRGICKKSYVYVYMCVYISVLPYTYTFPKVFNSLWSNDVYERLNFGLSCNQFCFSLALIDCNCHHSMINKASEVTSKDLHKITVLKNTQTMCLMFGWWSPLNTLLGISKFGQKYLNLISISIFLPSIIENEIAKE